MQNISTLLRHKTRQALLAAFKDLVAGNEELLQPEVEQSTNPQFGHYQCNNALKLAKALKMSPRDVAQKIILHFNLKAEDGSPIIEKMEIAGAGFINFTLNTQFLSREVDQ